MSPPRLSVVIPAFNEAARLPATLVRIQEHLDKSRLSHEILVVDDGSRDDTAARASEALQGSVRVLRNASNRGKGFSVRRGMLEATGARRLMSDADLSTPIEELDGLMRRMDEGFDVVIASRALPGANVVVHQGPFRENVGRLFNVMVQALLLPGLSDTQCGFKLWSAQAADESFGHARLDGFSFDVEVLYLARRRGRRIAEVPVTWRNDAASRVTLMRGSLAFLDLLRIRIHGLFGRYG
jgi:dolichyl-phosphate beta-glucosyltransferase